MAKPPKNVALTRPNGGRMLLPAHPEVIDGQTHFKVNVTDAPRPDRQFSGDDAFFTFEHPIAKLHFFQQGYGGVVRSALALRVSADAIARFADSAKDFMGRLATDAATHDWPNYVAPVLSIEPESATTLDANAMTVTQISSETLMDFYQFDITSTRDVVETGHVALDAVVRVVIPSHVALTVLGDLLAAAYKLQKVQKERAALTSTTKATS